MSIDIESILRWSPSAYPVIPVLVSFLALAYIALWAASRKKPGRYPASALRAFCFVLGCAIAFFVTTSGIEALASNRFSAFMFQQLTLMMIVSALLVVGSPGRVLLRGLGHEGVQGSVLRAAIGALRSKVARLALHPLTVTPVMIASFFGLYLSGLGSLFLERPATRSLLLVLLLGAGILQATPLMSVDPLPRRTSFVARLIDTFLEMQMHAIFGLVYIFTTSVIVRAYANPPSGLGIDPVLDQAYAGALVWTYGELPVVTILIITLVRWQWQDNRKAARASRLADANGDVELEQYNEYLESLRRGNIPKR